MISVEKNVAPGSEYFVHAPSRMAQRALLYPVQCGSFAYEPGYALARSSFDSFLLMYLRRGTLRVTAEDRERLVCEGAFVLLDCYRPHGYATYDGCEVLWLHFDGNAARELYETIAARLGIVFRMEDPTPVVRRMDEVLRTFREGKTVQEVVLARTVHDLLTELLFFDPEVEMGSGHADAAERAMTYIHEHHAEELTVDRLAAQVGMSPSHFIRVFRQETGYTPHGYIISCRMASARYLLRYTQLSVKEVCFSTGFKSESTFCSAFRKQHGMTPQEYRAT